jgi:NhaP-type Na+/H+ and K+/H+ antiporter
MLQASGLSPRDVNNWVALKDSGLSVVDVRISQLSFAKGQLLSNIQLPETARVLCVLRKGKPIVELEAVFLEENDSVYLLTDDEMTVRRVFTL